MATLITGVNGFIGKNLANFLRKKNIEIIGNGRKKKKYDFEYIQDDLSNLKSIPKKINTIIHLAADSEIKNNGKKILNSNVNCCKNLVKLIKKNNVNKLIYCSSISVYQNNKNKVFKETQPISNNLSDYANSKYFCEQLIYKKLKKKKNLSITILRLPAVVGKDSYKSSFYTIKKKIFNNKKISIFNFDHFFNGLVLVDKLSEFMYLLLMLKKHKFKLVNIGSSKPLKFKKAILELAKSMKKKINYELEPKGNSSVIDISRAMKLGFKPQKTLSVIKEFAKIKM